MTCGLYSMYEHWGIEQALGPVWQSETERMKWRKISMCLRRSTLTECGWTCLVGLWVVWCHHSRMHSVGPASVSCFLFPICLFFDLPSHLLLRYCRGPFCLVLRTALKKKKKKAVCNCTNNRCVLWSQATTSILRNVMFPTLWHNLAKAILLVVFCSAVNYQIHSFSSWPSCVWYVLMQTSHPWSLLQFRCFGSSEGGNDRILSVVLPTVKQ